MFFQNDERAVDVRGEVELDGARDSLVGRPVVSLAPHPHRTRKVGPTRHEGQAQHLAGRHHLRTPRSEIRRKLNKMSEKTKIFKFHFKRGLIPQKFFFVLQKSLLSFFKLLMDFSFCLDFFESNNS